MNPHDAPRVLAVTWVPLARAALCLDDETVFDARTGACPTCASRSWTYLANFLRRRVVESAADGE